MRSFRSIDRVKCDISSARVSPMIFWSVHLNGFYMFVFSVLQVIIYYDEISDRNNILQSPIVETAE